MNIIILGSEGFIGSHLITFYNNGEHKVSGCDLIDVSKANYTYYKTSILSEEFDAIFSNESFDICINASGNGNVSYSMDHPFNDFQANTAAVAKVLDTLRKYNPSCKLIHISSAAIYGNPRRLPIHESAQGAPMSPYGWHKIMAEQLCSEYNFLYNIPIAVVRPFSIYGPGLKKQLLWDTFQKFKRSPREIELWGTGNESRDFIFIEDVVRAFDIILKKAPMRGEVYNIASGTETTTKEVVEQLFYFMGVNPMILFNNQTRQGDPLNWKADITEISKLGFTPLINLKDGIKQTVSWLLKL